MSNTIILNSTTIAKIVVTYVSDYQLKKNLLNYKFPNREDLTKESFDRI